MHPRSRLLSRLHDVREDGGFSLVLVMGFTSVIAGLSVLTATLGARALRSSDEHLNFEMAMATAEAGVDDLLSEVSAAYNGSPSVTYVTGGACALDATADFADEDEEREWARDSLSALPDECLTPTSKGEYVAVRPIGKQAVYAMGWYPSRDAPRATRRLVKAEYLFAPYKPQAAVLTQGDLEFSGGSVAVNAVGAALGADVHTNSRITDYPSGNSLAVDGQLTSSGSPLPGDCPPGVEDGCAAGEALQGLPVIKAGQVYSTQAMLNSATWYDLCPDGRVRAPSSAGPCLGTELSAAPYRGWEFTAGSSTVAPVWTLPRTAGGPYPGTYYVHEGDAVIGNSGNSSTTWQMTVIAAARTTGVSNPSTCDKLGGNIEWRLFNMTPALSGLQLLADANLTGSANNTAGTGLFLAGDKVDLSTSSMTLNGAVVASNSCSAQGSNTMQGVTVNYDDTVEAPVADVIRTSLWLEYPAG